MRRGQQPFRPAADLPELLQNAVNRDPDAVFVFWRENGAEHRKTYADLDRDSRAQQIFLQRRFGTGRRIAVTGENSYAWITAFLGIIRSGNIAVAVDQQFSAEKKAELLHKTDCCACIAGDHTALPDETGVIRFSALTPLLREQTPENAADFSKPDRGSTAAIFFTSGTSGECKGVCLSQEQIMAVINAACQAFAPQGTSMAVLPFHHVLGFIVSILMPMHFPYPVYLNSGLRNLQQDLCAASPQTMIVVPLFIESFYKQLRSRIRQQGKEKQLAFAEAVSGFLLRFGIDIRKQMFRKIRAAFGGKLEVLICGGAEIRQEYIDFFYKYGIIILNGYGMTETASVIAVNRAGHMRPNSLGKPLSCCEIRCAEDGEIMVRGACVMNGYDGQPARSPEEWYPTGDLGRMDADGFLYFTGRKKNLIILSNGENVSPEGIEQALLRDDAVAEVIVSAENGYPEAEIYPAPQGDPQSAVDAYNAHQPPYLKIRSVKIRSAPFPKNHSGKMIR